MFPSVRRYFGLIAVIGGLGLTLATSPALASAPPPPGPASVSLTPTTVDYGTQRIGAVGQEAVLDARNQTGFTAQSAYVGGDPHFSADFDNCTNVAPAATCDIGVTFTPTTLGPVTAQEYIALCSGPNLSGTCVRSNDATLKVTALPASGNCPAGATDRTVDVGPLVATACITQIDRTGDLPLYLVSGSASISGLSFNATGKTTVFPTPTFRSCASTSTCGAAIARFAKGDDGPEMVLDPALGSFRIVSNREYLLSAGLGSDEITLFKGAIDAGFGNGAVLDLSIDRVAKLLGIPLTGRFQVFPEGGGARIHVIVGLPAALGGITGQTDVSVDETGDISLSTLHVAVGDALIGPLRVRNLMFDYTPGYLAGTALLSLPTPTSYELGIGLELKNGSLTKISASASNLNQPIGDGAFLQSISASLGLDPVDLLGAIGISAGPSIKNVQAAKITGSVHVQFPGTYDVGGSQVQVPYTRIRADGTLDVLSSPLAKAFLAVQTNGYLEAGGEIQKSASMGSVKGTIHGELSSSGFNFEGSAELSVKFLLTLKAVGQAIVSSTGIAACGRLHTWLSGGIGYKWGGSFATFHDCDLGDYRVAVRPGGAQAAAAGALGFHLPAGLPQAAVEVFGATAPPSFALHLPGGGTDTTPATATQGEITSSLAVIRQTENHVTVLVLDHPRGGTYQLMPSAGSAAVIKVDVADGIAPPQASATVTGKGLMRTLHWHLRTEPGQVVRFVELGPEDDAILETTTKRTGQVRFRVPDGIAGPRVIQAQFQEAGLPRADLTVGHYTAPAPPTPTRPAGLTLTRQAGNVMITWRQRGVAPALYELHVKLGDGETVLYLLPGSARSAMVTPEAATDSVTASLDVVDAEDVSGPQARRRLSGG